MADGDSVGKISLDMEVDGDLNKQISAAANKIGEQIKSSLSSINFKGFADSIGSTISKSVESSMRTVQRTIQDSLNKALSGVTSKIKGIKIPVSWDIPKNFIMPNAKSKTTPASPRAPPIPKVNTGVNLEAVKAQIDNLTESLDITNAKIEQQKEKLAQLKESYNMAFDGARKNKLLEQILQTEANINKLTAQSDKAGFKLADLDAQFEMLSNAAKEAGAGVEIANIKIRETANVATNSSRNLKKLESSARGSGDGFRSGYGGAAMFFDSMFKWGIVFPMIIGGLGTMASFIGSAFMANTQFANSLNLIKSNLYTAFMPIYNAVLPAINALMSGLATVTAYIASFVSALFGTTYNASFGAAQSLQTAIGAYDQTGKAAKKAATSLGGVGKAATASGDATKKAAKEAKGSLAAFDEINQLQMNKDPTTKEPKTPTPAGDGVVAPITPMPNMSPIETATAAWAEKFKNILAGLWEPFKQAWAAEGVNTVNAAKHALQGIEDLIGSIAKSFYTVWTNGTGEKILVNLLKILQDILNIIGDIGVTFANAWNNGNIGTQIIQTLANALNNVLGLIDKMLQSLRHVWAEEGPTFAALFMQALNSVSGVIENVTQKLGWIWDHGGQHAFEGFVKLGVKIGDLALFILSNFVTPFVNWFVNLISPAIAYVLNALGSLFDTLSKIASWLMGSGQPALKEIITTTTTFFAVWEITKLLGFIQMSGGLVAALGTITGAIKAATVAKIADKLETMGIYALYAVDFVKGIGAFVAAKATELIAWTSGLAVKTADKTETLAIYALYAGSFISAIVSFVATKATETAAWIASTAATVAQTAATVAWNAVCVIATTVTTAFGAAITFLTGPVGLVILAIGALIAIGVLLYKNWDTVSAFLTDCWNGIKAVAESVWNGIKDFLQTTWDNIKNTTIQSLNFIKDNIGIILPIIATLIFGPVGGILAYLITHWDQIKTGFINTWNDIKTATANTWNEISKFLSNLWQGISKTANSIWNEISSFFSNLWEGIKQTATSIWDDISTQFSNIWKSIANMFSTIWNGIKSTFSSVISSLSSGLSGLISYVSGAFTSAWSSAWSGIVNIFGNVFGGIVAIAKGPINGVISLVNSAISSLDSISVNIPDWVPGVGGKSFGVSIPNIPYLARGGIIDQPTLAMVGEAGKEAVVPLENTAFVDTLASAVANAILAAMQFSNNNSSNKQTDTRDIILQLDGTTLGRILKPYLDKENNRIGSNLIIKTT